MRKISLLSLSIAVSLSACNPATAPSGEDPAGVYALALVDGHALPASVFDAPPENGSLAFAVTSGALRLNADHTYTDTACFAPPPSGCVSKEGQSGTWGVGTDTVTLQPSAGAARHLRIIGPTLVEAGSGEGWPFLARSYSR